MSSFLLDTHHWLWFQNGDANKLRTDVVKEFTSWQRRGKLFVSAASIWEIAVALSKQRLRLGTPVEDWVRQGIVDDGLQLLSLTPEILIDSTRLPAYPFGDPADRMLMATARQHDLTFVTRDEKILRYGGTGQVRVLQR